MYINRPKLEMHTF